MNHASVIGNLKLAHMTLETIKSITKVLSDFAIEIASIKDNAQEKGIEEMIYMTQGFL